jgi:glucose-6-phosphate isomerase
MTTTTRRPKIQRRTTLPRRQTWKALQTHYKSMQAMHLRTLFTEDPQRGGRMTMEAVGVLLDYSKNRITDETIRLLVELAKESGLPEGIEAMFRGEKINVTENRAVLHVALRAPREASIMVDGENIVRKVHAVLDQMTDFAHRVRSGEWKGHTGKRIKNVVNIGIGGSDLGPVMAYEALKYYSERTMTFRFVSNVDGTDFAEAVRDLQADETLFIVSSKTFTTLETMTNANTAWAAMRHQWRSTLSPSQRMRQKSPSSASTRPTCFRFGTGSAAAIRCFRLSDCRPCWPSDRSISARC